MMKTLTSVLIAAFVLATVALCATILPGQARKTTVRAQSESSPTNLFLYSEGQTQPEQVRCSLSKENCELERSVEGQLRKTPAIRLCLRDNNGSEVWSLWQESFPDPHDFETASIDSQTMLAFVRGCEIEIVGRLVRNTEAHAYSDYLQRKEPAVHVNLCAMFGAQAFQGGNNALRENIRIKSVSYENGWRIAVEGNGGKQYVIAAKDGKWIPILQ